MRQSAPEFVKDSMGLLRDANLASMQVPTIENTRRRSRHSSVKADTHGQNFEFILSGVNPLRSLDVYHALLELRWVTLIGITTIAYLIIALIFAALYFIDPSSFVQPGEADPDFADLFFFSMRTMSSIDSHISPVGLLPNIFCSIQGVVSLIFSAFVTGSLFAKLSRPVARIEFAENCLIAEANGNTYLSFRVANQRKNPVVNVTVKATVLIRRVSPEGIPRFGYHMLQLDVPEVPIFVGSMQVKHCIDEKSPLNGFAAKADVLLLGVASIQIIISGTEEVYGQLILARHIYDPSVDCLFGHRFKRLLEVESDGRLNVRLDRLNEVEKIQDFVDMGHFVTRSRRSSEKLTMKDRDSSDGNDCSHPLALALNGSESTSDTKSVRPSPSPTSSWTEAAPAPSADDRRLETASQLHKTGSAAHAAESQMGAAALQQRAKTCERCADGRPPTGQVQKTKSRAARRHRTSSGESSLSSDSAGDHQVLSPATLEA